MKQAGPLQCPSASNHGNADASPGGSAKPRRRVIVAALLAALAVVAAASAILALALNLSVSVENGATDLPPQPYLTVSVWNIGGSSLQASLAEIVRDIDGQPGPSHVIPVKMVPLATQMPLELRTEYRLERTDGTTLLNLDGLYQLTLTSRPEIAGLPMGIASSRAYVFSTLTSPRPYLQEGVVPLAYQKPLELRWNQPIQSLEVETNPPLKVQTRLDPARKDVSYVELVGAQPGAEYELRVVRAVAATGAWLVAPAQLRVLTPAPPEPILANVKLEDADRVVLPWDLAITSLDYEITPAVKSVANVGTGDPLVSYILLQNPKQGQEYAIRIKGAVATTGAPLIGARDLKVTTPKALMVDKFLPEQPKWGVPLADSSISLAFSEPVKDRAAAEASISLTPSVKGKFEWTAPNLVEFVPGDKFPGATDFVVQVAGGKGGVRSADGGYLYQTERFTFWTAPEKEIEVNLTQQKLTLWEGGKPAWSTLVSTGVAGAETPTGLFAVDYKMAATRMRGVNPSGLRYDLTDVPWVMSFEGDYTIHGAYWRDNYGYPQSNGCVSMSIPDAKYLYDQTPAGTPVRIHY